MPAYLDHAATTPMLPSAAAAMAEQLAVPGNASSLHTSGRLARRVVEESRERIARALGARPSEVVFTSGGTESDNLAVAGTWEARRDADPARIRIVASAIEHHAVLDCIDHLVSHEGAKVSCVEPDALGVVTVDAVRAAIEEDPDSVALVTVMWANNEVGTVQPVAELAALAHGYGIPFHTDAVQAAGHLPVDFTASGVDLMTVTGHKVGGPLGVGALVVRRDAKVVPQTYGGGQERQMRSGTLDVPAIRAFAVAVEESVASLATETVRLVPGCEGDSLLYLLDAAGVECSTGSACQAGVPQPSHVLLAMGIPESSARGALRLTLGHTSTDADVDALLAALPAAVERARRASGLAS